MKKLSSKGLLLLLYLVGLSLSHIRAQDLAAATQLSTAGQYQEAEAALLQLLEVEPDNSEIRLAHAYNLAWMGKYKRSILAFKDALRLGANEEEATLGLAYAYAWSHQYGTARTHFSSILRRNVGNFNAKKGIAYTYLWQGNGKTALHYFKEIIAKQPEEYDLYIGQGMAHLQQKNNTAAESSFQMALELQPTSSEALQLLETARRAPNLFEFDIWAGNSWLGQDQQKFGLRGGQFSTQITKRLRAFIKYDNSLALDILNFAQRDKSVPIVTLGGVGEWNKNLLTEAEYGLRIFDAQQYQHLTSIGQVFFLPEGLRVKVGGYAGIGQNMPSEWMTFLSFNFPLVDKLHLEPSYYYVQPPGATGAEHRMQLGAQYRPRAGYEVNIYGFYGNSVLPESSTRIGLYGAGLIGVAPLHPLVSAQLIARYEHGAYFDFTSIAVGLKVRIDRLVQ